MSGCGNCGIPGHDINHCPELLEEYHGLPSDNVDEAEDEE